MYDCDITLNHMHCKWQLHHHGWACSNLRNHEIAKSLASTLLLCTSFVLSRIDFVFSTVLLRDNKH